MLKNGENLDLSEKAKNAVEHYIGELKTYSKKINVISKNITIEQIRTLIDETMMLEKYILENEIIDVGSGNGILGIPIAIINPLKRVILVEPRKKKSEFLMYISKELKMNNLVVKKSGIEEFVKNRKVKLQTMVARGFPNNDKLVFYVENGIAKELLLITSISKIKKRGKKIEKLIQNIYNVPFRDNLKIIHTRNVSRET